MQIAKSYLKTSATPSHASKRYAGCLEHIGWLCYCCCFYSCTIIFALAGSQSYVSRACHPEDARNGASAWSFGGSKGARKPPRSEIFGLFLTLISFYLMPLLICTSVHCTAVSRPRIGITPYFLFQAEARWRVLFCVQQSVNRVKHRIQSL